MNGGLAGAIIHTADAPAALFDLVGDFLAANRLDPDPVNYAFAYSVVVDPAGALAGAVETLTDGGVRLTRRDIETLGGQVVVGAGVGAGPVAPRESESENENENENDRVVARTRRQVEGFAEMMQAMRDETQGFGRDLAAGADAIRRSPQSGGVAEVMRITSAMVERVRTAETRLEAATHEASLLRAQLEEARDNARRDPLTDLPNRRAFEEGFAAACAGGLPLCLAVCDVDRFKSVNDRFGHPVGDRVLKAIAEALSAACHGQLVARYGGEEFAVLFSGIDLATAHATIDAARATVAAKRYRLRESEERVGEVTFSAGLVAIAAEEPCGGAMARADALLYAAKADGRNCIKAG